MAAGAGRNTGSRVQVIGRAWPKWRLATSGGSVTAEQVVVATDAYSEAPWSGLRSEQVRLPYFNFATEPLSDDLQRKILPERQGARRRCTGSFRGRQHPRSEEHTSELQSLMRISYAVFCLKKKNHRRQPRTSGRQ